MDGQYFSVESGSSYQMKIEGSRFIADLFPVATEEEAKEKLDSVRKKYFDATHHCYAYVIGAGMTIVRYSDDGEPSGTAGIKIHTALQSKNLSDILCVVTRYYGGTKLGVGGLGRAYHECTEAAIDSSSIIAKARMHLVRLSYGFQQTNAVMNLINARSLKFRDIEYADDRTIVSVFIAPSDVEKIRTALTNATRGNILMEVIEERSVII